MSENMQRPSKSASHAKPESPHPPEPLPSTLAALGDTAALGDLGDLADGRATEAQLDALLRRWSEDQGMRRDWAALHLCGEALRSPDVGAPAQSSEALLAGLRERIACEPVVLRPAHVGRAGRWWPPLGVAAGFVLLALIAPGLFAPLPPSHELGAENDPGQPLTRGLVAVPDSSALDLTHSFVQTIVAPDQPGQVSPQPVQASERMLSLPPPYAGASAGSAPLSSSASTSASPSAIVPTSAPTSAPARASAMP